MKFRLSSVSVCVFVVTLFFSAMGYAHGKNKHVEVKFVTTSGDFVVELYPDKAPKSVANFLAYMEEGYYNNTIFHRAIKQFMVQGGGFTSDMKKKDTKATIENESSNGLKNEIGTISMARTNAPHSATSQFFINTNSNGFLDFNNGNHGYAVFGKVVSGYEVVAKIENEPTHNVQMYQNVPVNTVLIKSVSRVTEQKVKAVEKGEKEG